MPTIKISNQALDRALLSLTESVAEARHQQRRADAHARDSFLPPGVRIAFERQANNHRYEYELYQDAWNEISRLRRQADSGGGE